MIFQNDLQAIKDQLPVEGKSANVIRWYFPGAFAYCSNVIIPLSIRARAGLAERRPEEKKAAAIHAVSMMNCVQRGMDRMNC